MPNPLRHERRSTAQHHIRQDQPHDSRDPRVQHIHPAGDIRRLDGGLEGVDELGQNREVKGRDQAGEEEEEPENRQYATWYCPQCVLHSRHGAASPSQSLNP
jgi:hypothetical protein